MKGVIISKRYKEETLENSVPKEYRKPKSAQVLFEIALDKGETVWKWERKIKSYEFAIGDEVEIADGELYNKGVKKYYIEDLLIKKKREELKKHFKFEFLFFGLFVVLLTPLEVGSSITSDREFVLTLGFRFIMLGLFYYMLHTAIMIIKVRKLPVIFRGKGKVLSVIKTGRDKYESKLVADGEHYYLKDCCLKEGKEVEILVFKGIRPIIVK